MVELNEKNFMLWSDAVYNVAITWLMDNQDVIKTDEGRKIYFEKCVEHFKKHVKEDSKEDILIK